MRKSIISAFVFLFISAAMLFSENIPGINAVKKYGTKLTPSQIVDRIGEILSGMQLTAGLGSAIFYGIMNEANTEPVFIIESIQFDKNGYATDIKGHVETPKTFREFVEDGGLGMPVYEAVEPNEFGVIFGRKGNIAVRDGVIVRINPLENSEIYEVVFNSDLYDKINRASVLFQAYEAIQTPYLENFIIELEGMILNSASKKEILEGIKEFKKTHNRLNEKELIAAYLQANRSYLAEIKKSNENARKRIKESEKLLETIDNACSLEVTQVTETFLQITEDTAELFLDPFSAPSHIAEYLSANIPKNDIKYSEFTDIQKYDRYQMNLYNKNKKKNEELLKMVKNLSKDL